MKKILGRYKMRHGQKTFVIGAVLLVSVFAFQNCGGQFQAVRSSVGATALSSTTAAGGATTMGLSAADQSFISALSGATGQITGILTAMGMSSTDVGLLTGATLSSGQVTSEMVTGAQASIDGQIDASGPVFALLPSDQRTQMLAQISGAITAVGSYNASTLSPSAAAVQAADLEILNRIHAALAVSPSPTATPAPGATPTPTPAPGGGSAGAGDAAFLSTLGSMSTQITAAVGAFASPQEISVLTGAALAGGTVHAADIQAVQASLDTKINNYKPLLAFVSAAQKATYLTQVNAAIVAISVAQASTLSTDVAALQACDIEVLTRLKAALGG